MPISLHAATIPSWLQLLNAGKGWLDKAAVSDIAEGELLEARLIDDMLPLKYQFKSMAIHSADAIEGVRKGVFSPDMTEPPTSFAGLGEKLDSAITTLQAATEEELESFIGCDMRFEIPGRFVREFTGDQFLLSFSEPNFYFHSSTAYGILRSRGIPVGKVDYLGQMRTKS